MRHTLMALLLVATTVSAVSATVAAFATNGKSACEASSPEEDSGLPAAFHRIAIKAAKRTLP